MTDYPKNDWRNAVPESDKYDRDALIVFRETLENREQIDEDMAFVMGFSNAEMTAYCTLCEAWTKQFGDSSEEVAKETTEEPKDLAKETTEEPKDLKERIQHRLGRLETFMKENKRDEATLLEPEISKFWSILSDEDKDFIQSVRIALEDDIDWKVE